MYKFVIVTDSDMFYKVFSCTVLEKFKAFGEIYPTRITRENINSHAQHFSGAQFILSTWGMPHFSADEIRQYFPNVTALFYGAGSVQGFAHEFLQCGIKVFSAWAANAIPVAEFTIAQILLANKGVFQAVNKFKDVSIGRTGASEFCNKFRGNYGARVGLLGIGMIGREVVRLLQPFNFEILAFDPFLSPADADSLSIKLTSLDEIFASCSVISNHLANNEQTVGILGYSHFSLMGGYSTFINTGRGAQVIEADLVCALKEVSTRTAVLDVTFPEPPNLGHDFYSMDNVFLTPHIAGSMSDEVARMGEFMLTEFLALSSDGTTHYEVTSAMLETMA